MTTYLFDINNEPRRVRRPRPSHNGFEALIGVG
jgi:hypothetical protein